MPNPKTQTCSCALTSTAYGEFDLPIIYCSLHKAAPALLEALRECDDPTLILPKDLYAKIRAAIRQATGEPSG